MASSPLLSFLDPRLAEHHFIKETFQHTLTVLQDPLFLDKCMVCCEVDWDDYFEVQELATKDSFVFKAEDVERTRTWYRQLQVHAQGLGSWRKRRNALANIMINGMQLRS
ncbi:uncharacterized protein LOC127750272 [Frankliniella occidentalis]|uniref:Uncharacterized protein LOC127750272 n=1 Tax=Frankliniella occidentalis TaxID=133901 RepID=A0A9C6X1J4_FRAOC|nr:uncharacterized protein LOC127750272 [Frankliniella occidentalis]